MTSKQIAGKLETIKVRLEAVQAAYEEFLGQVCDYYENRDDEWKDSPEGDGHYEAMDSMEDFAQDLRGLIESFPFVDSRG